MNKIAYEKKGKDSQAEVMSLDAVICASILSTYRPFYEPCIAKTRR